MNTPPPSPTPALDVSALRSVVGGKRILIAIGGGIAVYKVATVTSRLAQAGAEVTVLMTEAATKFVTPLTFQSLAGRAVLTSPWEHIVSHDPQHIALARATDLALVAPATMDLCAKLALGLAGDIVTLVLSAIDRRSTPVLIAPSMNETMWGQPSTTRNIAQLKADGFTLLDPACGWQACRAVGVGRLPEPEDLLAIIAASFPTRAT